MKQIITIFAVSSLMIVGCEKPSPVQVEEDALVLEPNTLQLVDPDLDYKAVDSSGVLPGDQQLYPGYFLINSVKFNTGAGERGFAYSSVFLGDRGRPVQMGGRTFGYFGVAVRSLLLNGSPMIPIPHIVRARLQSTQKDTIHAGVEYIQDLTSSYLPNQVYTWGIFPFFFDSISVSISSPDDLAILSPAGGVIHSRDQDLGLQWRGKGNLIILLSKVNLFTGETRPLLSFRPRRDQDHAIIRAKLLRSLSPGAYAFTFILANRQEIPTDRVHPGKILVQAASLYTTYFGLR
ncbi:MAG: hypothetical protein OEM41_03610 [Ignavibacteria bacterium]|nr:hypothetical protein [Ignavibacteria bacterium]